MSSQHSLEHSPNPRGGVEARVRRVVGVAGLTALTLGGTATVGAAQTEEPNGLQVTYHDDDLQLNNLSPGQSQQGAVFVTNHHDEQVTVDLSAAWEQPPLEEAGVELEAALCHQWNGTTCDSGRVPLELSTDPVRVGSLDTGASWRVDFTATLDGQAGNDTQNLSEDFELRLLAQADAPGEEEPEVPGVENHEVPDEDIADPISPDDDLAATGAGVWPLIAVAVALLAAGGFATRFAMARRHPRDNSRGLEG